jgi:hypothetical protein
MSIKIADDCQEHDALHPPSQHLEELQGAHMPCYAEIGQQSCLNPSNWNVTLSAPNRCFAPVIITNKFTGPRKGIPTRKIYTDLTFFFD